MKQLLLLICSPHDQVDVWDIICSAYNTPQAGRSPHLCKWHECRAVKRRLTSVFLQVEVDNEAGVGLYEAEGFRTHHAYAYLVH